MDENIYTYLVDLPDGINEMITPCADGYTVYIDARLDMAHRRKAYRHAMKHVLGNDFDKTNVQEIEYEAHKED